MVVDQILLARIKARFAGEPVINSLAFVDVGSDGVDWPSTAEALFVSLSTTLGLGAPGGMWTAPLSVQYHLDSIGVSDVAPGTSPELDYVVGLPGEVADEDAMAPNDSLCITWRSAFRGPGGRGRTYLTGFAEGSSNAGYWELAAQNAAATIAGAMMVAYGEGGTQPFRFVILHRMQGGVAVIPPAERPVLSFTIHNEVRSLGRRAVGRRIRRRRLVA